MIFVNCLINVPRQLVGAGRGVLKYREHDRRLPIQSRIGIHGIIYNCNVCDICQMNRPDLIDINEQGIRDIFTAVIFIADAKHPGLVILIVYVAGRHSKVLSINQLGKSRGFEKSVRICIFKRRLSRALILFSRRFELCLGTRELNCSRRESDCRV